MNKLRDLAEKINISRPALFNEPLAQRTTFKAGGPADLLLEPSLPEELARIRRICRETETPVTLLGGGANVLIADAGIRGVTVATGGMDRCTFFPESLRVEADAGCRVDNLVKEAATQGWGGLSFLAGLPGTMGGALWMNARCYGREMSDLALSAVTVTEEGGLRNHPLAKEDFAYKSSPFQGNGEWIASVTIRLEAKADSAAEQAAGDELREDRRAKGHYRAPCAGSTFKNNRAFGRPSGQIIDECGLKGLSVGGASVSDWHGNILINGNRATAAEIRSLIELVQEKVQAKTGFLLEPEVQYLGDWR